MQVENEIRSRARLGRLVCCGRSSVCVAMEEEEQEEGGGGNGAQGQERTT